MDKLIEIADKAIADYGFRQIVMWSPSDVIDRWELSPSLQCGPRRRSRQQAMGFSVLHLLHLAPVSGFSNSQ